MACHLQPGHFHPGSALTSPEPTTSTVTASASPGAGIISVDSTQNNSGATHSWGSNGGIATGALNTANNDYFEFAINTTGFSSVHLSFAAREQTMGRKAWLFIMGLLLRRRELWRMTCRAFFLRGQAHGFLRVGSVRLLFHPA